MPTQSDLNSLLGKHISQICTRGYAHDNDNHCAHFVSHVFGFQFGTTCGNMARGTGDIASIRVHEVFAQCDFAGDWNTRLTRFNWALVFMTNANGVDVNRCTMANVVRKHVGIYLGGPDLIWHYSNSQRQVISQTPLQFSTHYPAPHNSMFWGYMFR